MKPKKAQVHWKVVGWAMALLLLGVVAYVIIGKLVPTVEQAGGAVTGTAAVDAACKKEGEFARLAGKTVKDDDFDLRPDLSCDSCFPGNNDDDADNDGVPDACDHESENPNVGFCFKADAKDCSEDKCCNKKLEETLSSCGPGGAGTYLGLRKEVFQCRLSS
jgi:hypothetical protein